VLVGLLLASTAVAVWVWFEIGDVAISNHGLTALALGAVLTFGLGAGLMTLVFVSNRRGYDHQAHQPHNAGTADRKASSGPRSPA
jgi:hypothetical protein